MEMETKGTIEAIARNIQKNLKIIEPSLKMGLKEAYDSESTFRLSLSIGIKPTSQLDREIKGRISFPVFKISKALQRFAVDEGQMELEFNDEEDGLLGRRGRGSRMPRLPGGRSIGMMAVLCPRASK